MSDDRLDPITEERIYLFKVLRDDETLAALRSRIRELIDDAQEAARNALLEPDDHRYPHD